MNNKNEILEFYKQTSLYTDLGLYKEFAKSLTDDIDELCILQNSSSLNYNIMQINPPLPSFIIFCNVSCNFICASSGILYNLL